jgi:hypothetical protein
VNAPAIPARLLQCIAESSGRPVSPRFMVPAKLLRTEYRESVVALLLYGSSQQADDPAGGVADYYVIVDDYRHAYQSRWLRLLNAWLPPNVFYLESTDSDGPLRAKYAVISLPDFEYGTGSAFNPYFRARFAQPVRLVYARDGASRDRINHCLAVALVTFLESTAPLLPGEPAELGSVWAHALTLSYATELRPDSAIKPAGLGPMTAAEFREATLQALELLGGWVRVDADGLVTCTAGACTRKRAARAWLLRRWQGRVLSLLRLMKATFTFRGGVDYAAWKVRRHTGESFEVTPRLRRHPLLFGWVVLWRLVRRGLLR